MSELRYLSVCSGIEAATMAWHPLGWTPVGFAEIEAFPSAVLAHHYGSNMPGQPLSQNGVPNFGDFTQIQAADCGPVDLLVGGTPCQDFSIAGLRKGLSGERGNLTLEFLRLAQRLGPRWLAWENVPGVLSDDGGRAFGAILGGMVELGYGIVYRVLDAQFIRVDGFWRAVPQRRRRVFVVGYLGDWRRAAAVLLEREGLSRHLAPSRGAGKVAPTIPSRSLGGGGLGTDFDCDGGLVARSLNAHPSRSDGESETFVVAPSIARTLTRGAESAGKGGYAGRRQEDDDNLVAHSLRAEGFDASEDGTGRGTPLVPAHPYTLAIRGRGDGHQLEYRQDGTANAILTPNGGRAGIGVGAIAQEWAVRRLTPRECERLQGFPDDFTAVPFRGKPAADGPRYKALGNSMAVNVMRWIGTRIDQVEALTSVEVAA